MEIRLASKAGFCFGVKRAIDLARATLDNKEGPVYSLGPLIHNPQVVSYLAQMGLEKIHDLGEIEEGTLVIRSHGVGPALLETAREKGLDIVDATCPYVRRAQDLARQLAGENIQVVVVGDKAHPEVQGIIGWTSGKAMVVENPEEAAELTVAGPIGVVAQTTQPQENFDKVVDILRKTGAEVRVCNTICNATAERQKAALDLARQVDVMVVVGGKNSANTRKLASLCHASGTRTYHIEEAGQLDPAWFQGVKVAGLTAGASTPDWIIEEVMRRMSEFEGINSSEEVNNIEEGMKEAVEVKAVRHGDILTGTVVHVGMDEVMVDVGAKSEGIIPARELSCCEVTSLEDIVKVGDEIEVYVLKAEDNEGKLILSKEKADAEKAWVKLEEALNTQEPVEGTVREVVKGGLLVDVGVRAFLPASLVDMGYVEDLSKYLGQVIKARVIELNRSRKKVILSRKAVLEEEYARRREELLASLQENQVVKGVVRRLTQFGAFVDIGGVDGLLHISEMSWHRINHPSEVVNVGDEIEVMVLKIDRENEKISLGLKQVLPNPWDTVAEKYPVGSIVKAKVVRLAPFGAFVQLEPGVEGLVHISHLADRHVAKPDEVVSEGEEVNVKVLSVDPAEKRIRLSIREVAREKQSKEFQDYSNSKPQDNSDVVTIGDMVGDLFEKKDNDEKKDNE
ncbi:MAG TPA: bifunctional 4-hydroxy-3-methylbut-2-enyl diphosphate reductase/30S ribosomal protein S1 [Bacillota bacterium]|nr:bifunctional 4-hydroxy-3-methylbut-2-enyl diphosphate reductase/30S ribosomal protein S1 [Bacillota bacterium]HQD75547.1 bifunctional 4-hydroxy-3-methylbut-2-enyl diphosphate reductase/30S ribosomal protein S1 [Bacillota bacterium]HUM57838.1 bifunctional 4-hydroxy-3-methylbut-2-enyl diphosphate reductase/30S ribosomal protein S1 [Bacillota bacterium]